MKKVGVICLIICLLLCLYPVSAADLNEDASVTSGCNTLDGCVPVLGRHQIVKNAAAVLLYETNTDTLMYAYNADDKIPPASLSKILTALIAIEKGDMNDAVAVRADVLSTVSPGAAVSGLIAGEVLTVRDLLYCMMVASGNDAAAVLAEHVMGSQKAFVDEMNRDAVELGCTGTNFTNVHGLHNKNQYTTARDVGRFLAKAIQNEQFREVFGAKYYAVPATNKSDIRHLYTQNYLLNSNITDDYYDTRVTGSRTGVANDMTRNIASTAKVGEMNLLCVVMGSKSDYDDKGNIKKVGGYEESRMLLDSGFNGYKAVQILHPNQVLLQSSVVGGSSDVSIGTADAAFAVIPYDVDADDLVYRYVNEKSLTAPIEKGEILSTVQVWCGSLCIAQEELYALNKVEIPQAPQEKEPIAVQTTDFWTVFLYVLGALLVIALLGFIVMTVLRATKIAKAKKQSRRNSRNRRRSR